ncbi:crystal protein-like [Ylistrum balloti]|uniref:crystal protein-like n=1 Tax=Ylistrum balloti TaxID=509963 RepID=UPI0029059EE0|nr:crystal protein-like [Ylistrum balloti]
MWINHVTTILRVFVLLGSVPVCMCVYAETLYGWVRGRVTPEAIVFQGIPYASPPERWEHSQPPPRWVGVWDATQPRPMCFQPECGADEVPGVCLPQMSEDCLFLNLYVPVDARPGGNKSVMVFIHGGGFESYTAGADIYNGERFVNKGDVILVTFNYRLGALGFLVTGSGPGAAIGNYGIHDQRLALQWIKHNILNFGGDPEQVTLFGQSAGATSTAIHLTSGNAEHLFQRAILQSAPFSIPFKTYEQALDQGRSFSAELGCPTQDFECMKQKSPMEIIDAQKRTSTSTGTILQRFMPWAPHLDGNEVPLNLQSAFEMGVFVRKPVMLGTTANEGVPYIYKTFKAPLSRGAFSAMLFLLKPRDAMNLFLRYFPRNVADAREEFSQLATDLVFTCPTRKIARDLERRNATWLYVFDYPWKFLNTSRYVPYCKNKACHAAEIPFLFQSVHHGGFRLSMEDQHVADELLIYWTNFAKFENPNGDPTEEAVQNRTLSWPLYTSRGPFRFAGMVFKQPQSQVELDYFGVVCNAFDQNDFRAK